MPLPSFSLSLSLSLSPTNQMEENRFKLRISRMFRSSFGSCRSKNITDVIEKNRFLPENKHHHQLIDLFSPKSRSFPAVYGPKCHESFDAAQTSIINRRNSLPRNKLFSDKKSLFLSAEIEGQKCPHASPISPLNSFFQFQDCEPSSKAKEKRSKKAISKRVRIRSKSFGINEFPACTYNGLFSSDEDGKGQNDYEYEEDDDDKRTLFSSRSLSSDSSACSRRMKARQSNKNAGGRTRQRRPARNESETAGTGPMPLKGKVKDSFAVVKRSSHPYNDFRSSMVEMIVERQIFSAMDLENLLQCFLSLNSYHHHKVIIEVFTEIWEALFSNWS